MVSVLPNRWVEYRLTGVDNVGRDEAVGDDHPMLAERRGRVAGRGGIAPNRMSVVKPVAATSERVFFCTHVTLPVRVNTCKERSKSPPPPFHEYTYRQQNEVRLVSEQ